MNKKKKRIIIGAVSVVAAAAIIAGGITVARNMATGAAKVYDVTNFIMTDYYEDSSMFYGYAAADRIQSVYSSDTLKITSIAVTEGQEVKQGDLILSYDSTLTEIELEQARLQVERLKLQIENAKKELAEINTYQPRQETPSEDVPSETVSTPYLYGGSGSEEDPYIYVWGEDDKFTAEFIDALFTEENETYAVFVRLQEDALDGEILDYWGIRFEKEDESVSFSFFEAMEPDIGKSGGGEDIGGYTAAEIAQMKAEKQKEIRDLDVQARMAQVDYESMQREMGDNAVYAAIDGTVSSLISEEEAKSSGSPILTISGGGGYYINASISELERETMEIGTPMGITDWETGNYYTGYVAEVGDTPVSDATMSGNMNASYYSMKIMVDDSEALVENHYYDLTRISEEGDSSLYLMNAFISKENGKSYIYLRDEAGKLARTEISTGKVVWDEYTQVYDGISMDDYIAFPYGAAIKDGANTVEADAGELYE